MEIWGDSEANFRKVIWKNQQAGKLLAIAGCLLLLVNTQLRADPLLSTENPTAFFTNLAERLLQSELQVELNRIVVFPTNGYSPSVHRLLQVTANLYDATTNRGDYPFVPSVFRPLFRRTAEGEIVIAGYREVVGDGLAHAETAPALADLESGLNTNAIPELGTPFGADRDEPLVAGVPLIIGARKGFPNFNEFAMQNAVQIARRLRFERPVSPPGAPVNATNQIFVVSITNVFGVEAWNSYSTSFPRPLKMMVVVDLTAKMTNEGGNTLLSNRVFHAADVNIPASTWSGYNRSVPSPSFRIPLSTNITFLAPSVYSPTANENTGAFVTPTNFVAAPASGPFYVPRWHLSFSTRLRFILVDNTNIVDYVSLKFTDSPLDLTSHLNSQGDCVQASEANLWCTNRWGNGSYSDDRIPTYGIVSQTLISAGMVDAYWSFSNFDPSYATSKDQAIGSFFYNLYGRVPLGYPGTYYRSNVFFAPYIPVAAFFTQVKLQAKDPLVHYTLADLWDPSLRTNVSNTPDVPPLPNLGQVNAHYEPWGFSSSSSPVIPPYEIAAKDPLVYSSDAWDFPTNQPLNVSWLGRVHRSTPWQTFYLKSPSINLSSWGKWIGVPYLPEAQRLHPTNDWHLVQVLASLFNTNDPRNLLALNQPDAAAWASTIDGMVALTNTVADSLLLSGDPAQFDILPISSNSPPAASLSAALHAARYSQPGRHFREVGEILAVPELTVASPWLNRSTIQQHKGISDAAYEMVPSQLLPRLRPDSVGSLLSVGSHVQLQFTGLDDYTYTVEVSTNLVDWTAISTNRPNHGAFLFIEPTAPDGPGRFYRSVLLP